MANQVSFEVPREAEPFIEEIVARAEGIAATNRQDFDRLSCRMDLCACHANGNPLDFQRLAAADDFNLIHDVWGIAKHTNRETGELEGFFSPRFSQRIPA